MVEETISLSLSSVDSPNEKKQYVKAHNYDIIVSGKRVGRCVLRIGHNQNTFWGGNIGYFIDPPFRGQNYAQKACLLLFEEAVAEGLDYLIITCNPDNIASRKTCEKLPNAMFLGILALPQNNEMRFKGETEKCVYKYFL